MSLVKRFNPYHIGIFLSATSMAFGLLREFIIIGLLGFSVKNDMLQVYLSIFYTIGLMIDAIRLACLNLFAIFSLTFIVIAASIVALPFAIVVGLTMSYFTTGLDKMLLAITILGSYLNLIAALLITYKQRNNVFLGAQVINVLPNFILIPGIILCYLFTHQNLILAIVTLTSLIPLVQCILLVMLPDKKENQPQPVSGHWLVALFTFLRHFSSVVGEQLFQIITRSAFFQFGEGYLSLLTLCIRLYSAFRFILIDSYIGSKLFSWNTAKENDVFIKMIRSTLLSGSVAGVAFLISLKVDNNFVHACMQMCCLLIIGFYFSTLVRIMYFKINRYENNTGLVLRFASYELLFAGLAFMITRQAHYSIFTLLWIGLIAKPLTQLFLLRKKFTSIHFAASHAAV